MEDTQTPEASVIRLLVADEIARTISYLHSGLNSSGIEICGVARKTIALLEELRTTQPDVLLINENFDNTPITAIVGEISEISPVTKLIVLSTSPSESTITSSEFPMIAAVIDGSTNVEEIVSLIEHVAGKEAIPNEEELEPIVPVVPLRLKKRPGKADVFTIFAGKGGVGKSMIATNLATALSEQTGGKVALVDLDLQFGDIGIMVGISSYPHRIDALTQLQSIDGDYLEEILATGPASIRILFAPTSPELADLVMTSDVRSIIHELEKIFDYVIIDTSSHLEERVLEAFEASDVLIIVTSFNITAVKDTKITLRLLQSLGVPQDKLVLVLNQTRPKSQFTKEDIESTLRYQALLALPYDPKTVDDSIDSGSPFTISGGKSEIAKAFGTLTDYLSSDKAADSADKGQKRRRFPFGK